METRKITIEITNEEIDSLEDFVMMKLDPNKKEKAKNLVLGVWGKLCKKWDAKTDPNTKTCRCGKIDWEFSPHGNIEGKRLMFCKNCFESKYFTLNP